MAGAWKEEVAVSQEEGRKCSACNSTNLKSNVPVNRPGLHYMSGVIVKTEPLKSSVCLDCGKVDWYVENPADIRDKELVRDTSSNFLPFVLFALFILSLQLD